MIMNVPVAPKRDRRGVFTAFGPIPVVVPLQNQLRSLNYYATDKEALPLRPDLSIFIRTIYMKSIYIYQHDIYGGACILCAVYSIHNVQCTL